MELLPILKVVIMFLYVHNSSQECTQKYPILSSFYADISEDEDEVYGDTFDLIQQLIITLKAHYSIHFMVMSPPEADLTRNIFMATNPSSTV